MAKVNLTPFASSMHVEGETGGGGDEIVCKFAATYDDSGNVASYIRLTDEDPYFLLDAVKNGKIVKGLIHTGDPDRRDGDIQYSTAVVLSRSGSMGAFGGIEFTFTEIPKDMTGSLQFTKIKIKTDGGLAAWAALLESSQVQPIQQ